MLHSEADPLGVTPAQFATHLRSLYYNPAAEPQPFTFPPADDWEDITVDELQQALGSSFNGSASSGLCPVPTQVIKHLTGAGLKPLA